jgi:hypothetical protein
MSPAAAAGVEERYATARIAATMTNAAANPMPGVPVHRVAAWDLFVLRDLPPRACFTRTDFLAAIGALLREMSGSLDIQSNCSALGERMGWRL